MQQKMLPKITLVSGPAQLRQWIVQPRLSAREVTAQSTFCELSQLGYLLWVQLLLLKSYDLNCSQKCHFVRITASKLTSVASYTFFRFYFLQLLCSIQMISIFIMKLFKPLFFKFSSMYNNKKALANL